MGVFEFAAFAKGTYGVAETLAELTPKVEQLCMLSSCDPATKEGRVQQTLASGHFTEQYIVNGPVRDKLSMCCAVCFCCTSLKVHVSVLTPQESQILHKARESGLRSLSAIPGHHHYHWWR